ncbi:MAG TPA: DUF3052 domain-containing protein [Acidimicrobiales bacterium]|nr:DUF3052 domain-containing protein [Acidimicrobiales bacterium]
MAAVAGYSGTPLQKKLGFEEGWTVAVLGDAPEGFADQFTGLDIRRSLPAAGRPPASAALAFVRSGSELQRVVVGRVLPALPDDGMVWVAWPKKASGVPTDLTENVVRDVILPTGWVDVKVCAIDDTWSGLKFVKRLKERRRPS